MKKSLNLFYISKTSRVRCKIQSNFLTRKELNSFVFCIFELGFLYLFDVNGFQSKLDLALNKPQSQFRGWFKLSLALALSLVLALSLALALALAQGLALALALALALVLALALALAPALGIFSQLQLYFYIQLQLYFQLQLQLNVQ